MFDSEKLLHDPFNHVVAALPAADICMLFVFWGPAVAVSYFSVLQSQLSFILLCKSVHVPFML